MMTLVRKVPNANSLEVGISASKTINLLRKQLTKNYYSVSQLIN